VCERYSQRLHSSFTLSRTVGCERNGKWKMGKSYVFSAFLSAHEHGYVRIATWRCMVPILDFAHVVRDVLKPQDN
jgi:hypothetical protein